MRRGRGSKSTKVLGKGARRKSAMVNVSLMPTAVGGNPAAPFDIPAHGPQFPREDMARQLMSGPLGRGRDGGGPGKKGRKRISIIKGIDLSEIESAGKAQTKSAYHNKEAEIRKILKKKMQRQEVKRSGSKSDFFGVVMETKASRRASLLISGRRGSIAETKITLSRGGGGNRRSSIVGMDTQKGRRSSMVGMEGKERKGSRRASVVAQSAAQRLVGRVGGRERRGPMFHFTRSVDDATALHILIRHIRFFGDFPDAASLELCKVLKYEVMPEGGCLFKQGDQGDNMYIILTGKVHVCRFQDELQALLQRTNLEKEGMDSKDPANWEQMYGKKVVEMTAPQSFGEIALLREDVRTATILADPGTEFMIINAFDFDRILRSLGNIVFMPERLRQILAVPPNKRNLDSRSVLADLLCRHRFMDKLGRNVVFELSSKMILAGMEQNEIIFKQGETGTQFFIILSGSVTIRLKEAPAPGQRRKPARTSITSGVSGDHDQALQSIGEEDEDDGTEEGTFFSGGGSRILADYLHHDELGVELVTLKRGDSFGDRALLQQATPRTASAIAAEYSELMVLEQSDFQRIFHIQGRSMGFEKLAELLKIPPGRRTGGDCHEIMSILLKVSSFFQTMDKKLHNDICQVAKYKKLDSNSIVFEQGEEGDAFFIIIRGRVSIHVSSNVALDSQSKAEKEEKDAALASSGLDITSKYGQYVKVLTGGHSFGELALLHGKPRTGTIITQEETEFLVIMKEDYDRILQRMQSVELENHVKFLRNFPVMKHWPTSRLVRLAYCFNQIEVEKGTILLDQGEPVHEASLMYVIDSGGVLVTRKSEVDLKRISTVKEPPDFFSMNSPQGLRAQVHWYRNNDSSDTMRSLGIPQDAEIACLGAGEVCGEIAAILGVEQPATMVTTCTTVLHACKVEDFHKNLVLSDGGENIMDDIEAHCKRKLNWIEGRGDSINSALENIFLAKSRTSFEVRKAEEMRAQILEQSHHLPASPRTVAGREVAVRSPAKPKAPKRAEGGDPKAKGKMELEFPSLNSNIKVKPAEKSAASEMAKAIANAMAVTEDAMGHSFRHNSPRYNRNLIHRGAPLNGRAVVNPEMRGSRPRLPSAQ